MSLPIRLRRAAQAEFDAAADWYESRKPGLSLRFVAAVRQVLDTISNQPDRYPEVWPGVREAPVSGWPSCVYYQVHPDHIMVLAVFHTARDPSVWQSRA
jgi:plasmid stabilization system protein ParE